MPPHLLAPDLLRLLIVSCAALLILSVLAVATLGPRRQDAVRKGRTCPSPLHNLVWRPFR